MRLYMNRVREGALCVLRNRFYLSSFHVTRMDDGSCWVLTSLTIITSSIVLLRPPVRPTPQGDIVHSVCPRRHLGLGVGQLPSGDDDDDDSKFAVRILITAAKAVWVLQVL